MWLKSNKNVFFNSALDLNKESKLDEDFVKFIETDNTILQLINKNEQQTTQSERFQLFAGKGSWSQYKKDAKREFCLIGMDFTQVMRYAAHLVKKKLVRPCKDNKENLYFTYRIFTDVFGTSTNSFDDKSLKNEIG